MNIKSLAIKNSSETNEPKTAYIEFEGEGDLVEKLETQYRRDERVIRFLTFKQDKFAVEYSEKRRAKLSNKQEE